MADDHRIIALRRELASCAVRDGDIIEYFAGFEFEGGDYGDCLLWDEFGEGVFGLGRCASCGNISMIDSNASRWNLYTHDTALSVVSCL